MRINLITKTYNESRLVPYFFRHYDQFVTNYYIWDNMSTDGTRDLLLQNPKVTMFDNSETEFDDYKHRDFKNNAWKDFQDCDWIINCDFDEFLYHPDLIELLSSYVINNIGIVGTKGYQMFSEKFITSEKQIYEVMNLGIREPNYDKPILFMPETLPEFSFGAHHVEFYLKDTDVSPKEVKLLHYKFIGKESIENLLTRNERLSERNKSENLSYWPEEKGHRFNPAEVYENLKNNAIPII